MCRSFVAQLKCLDPGSTGTKALRRTVKWVMLYAQSVQGRLEEGQSTQSFVSLMDEFERTATKIHKATSKGLSWPCEVLSQLVFHDEHVTSGLTFLSFAIMLGLHTYVEAKVRHGCLSHDDHGVVPLLGDAIKPRVDLYPADMCIHSAPSIKMVKMLLEHGADPNMVCLSENQGQETTPPSVGTYSDHHKPLPSRRTNSVWYDLLRRVTVMARSSESMDSVWIEVIYWFLVYGADPTVDLGARIRPVLRARLSKDKFARVMAIMKARRRQTWFRKKNPNLRSSLPFKTNENWECQF